MKLQDAIAHFPKYRTTRISCIGKILRMAYQAHLSNYSYLFEIELPGNPRQTLSVTIDGKWCDLHRPQVGGYIVAHDDGIIEYMTPSIYESSYVKINSLEEM